MKSSSLLYKLVIISLLAMIISPSPAAVSAEPLGPDEPDANGSLWEPIIVFPGLIRGWLDGGDPDVIPPAPSHPNDQLVIGAVPDTTGAAGHTHYLQAVNKSIRITLKDGTLIDEMPFDAFWGPATTNTICDGADHHGQPYLIYDHLYLRWVVVDVAYTDIDTGPYYLCLAVSNGNPAPVTPAVYFDAANWFYYAIEVRANFKNYYPDSPKIGLWPDGYYLSLDLYDVQNNGTWRNPEGAMAVAVNRARAVAGVSNDNLRPISVGVFEGSGYEGMVPTNLLGDPPPDPDTPNYYASIEPGRYHVWEFDVDWTHETASFGLGSNHAPNVTIYTDTDIYQSERNVVPQPGVIERVDNMNYRLTSPLQYRNVDGIPSLWSSHSVYNGAETGLRWYEMQFAQDGTPYFYQMGTYMPPDGNYRWLPSMAVDKTGNMAIGYNISNDVSPSSIFEEAIFPSLYYTGRLRDDVPGTLGAGENILDLPGVPFPYNGSQYDDDFLPDGPWGRQSQMTVDPTDDCLFWFTSMYYHDEDGDPEVGGPGDGFTWYTRVGAFSFPECRTGHLTRVSLHTNNTEGHGSSGLIDEILEMYSVATSMDGRYVVFPSDADDLIDDDNNDNRDIFLRDRDADNDGVFDEPGAVTTSRIPIHTEGPDPEPNSDSHEVSISYDGRYVVFSSQASNLIIGDTNAAKDIFLYDRDADDDGIFDEPDVGATSTVRVSESTGGAQAFGDSKQPFISGDGSKIAFSSLATNLDISQPDTNLSFDIFIYDRDPDDDGILDEGTNTTTRVSLTDADSGTPNEERPGDSVQPTLSADGTFLAFSTLANLDPDNLVDADFIPGGGPQLDLQDVYLRDLRHDKNIVASAATGGAVKGDDRSYTPYISGNGYYVTYASEADNLDPLDTNVVYGDIYRTANPMVGSDDTTWVYNAALFVTNLVSVNFAGTPGNGPSYSPSINFDGSQISYASEATNLDPFVPDTNFRRDIFLYDLATAVGGMGTFGTTQRITMDREMGEANESSYVPIVAPGGSQVVFVSEASDLVWNDRNYVYDVFAYDGTVDRPVFLKIIGNTVPVDIGGTVDVDVHYTAHGYELDAFAFTIDYDESCLLYQSHSFSVPPAFWTDLTVIGDPDGELGVTIYAFPQTPMPDDIDLMTISFQVLPTCNTWDGVLNMARVGFSRNPMPSFGSYGQSVRGIVVGGFVRIGEGTRGDCNGNGLVEAGDLSALVNEFFDGDGSLPQDVPGGTFPGNPVGCNSNADHVVDAGDLSCTVDIIFNGQNAACLGAADPMMRTFGPDDTAVELNIMQDVVVTGGEKAYMPVSILTNGNSVNSMVLSVDIDGTWLWFDPSDNDGDGLPDNIIWNVPAGFTKGFHSYNPLDTNGEIDLFLYTMTPGLTVEDGLLFTLVLETLEPPVDLSAHVNSSTDPTASFGSSSGDYLMSWVENGSVQLTTDSFIFLPFIQK